MLNIRRLITSGCTLVLALMTPCFVFAQNCPPGYTNNGLTCGRGADSMSNNGSRVADCPPSYTNNGATCGRGADSFGNGGSRVADCPPSYTNNGATCGRGADSISNGGSRVADCPAGFRNWGATCQRVWPPKTLGMGSMTCRADEFRTGARCYKNCPQGYTNTGVSCLRPVSTLGMGSMTCNPGEFKSGARCYTPCPSGYTNTGVSCFRPVSTLGMDSMSCSPDEFKSGARCYRECPILYTNTGVSCFRPASTLPRSSNINWITPPEIEPQKFYNVAHMANTNDAARWAIGEGANGLEMDLNFNANGEPSVFKHGGVCDCSCKVTGRHICSNGLNNSCDASSGAAEHLNFIANLPGVALVYIDSKLDNNTYLPNAGRQVVRLLQRELFDKGYKGIVVVGAPEVEHVLYLRLAVEEAAQGPYFQRMFFGLDQVRSSLPHAGDAPSNVVERLRVLPGFPNLVYSTGITACLADTFYREISGGVRAQVAGDVSLTGIWTIDLERSMVNYLQLGARAIVTNRPGVLKQVVDQYVPQLTLASPGDSPPLRRH